MWGTRSKSNYKGKVKVKVPALTKGRLGRGN